MLEIYLANILGSINYMYLLYYGPSNDDKFILECLSSYIVFGKIKIFLGKKILSKIIVVFLN